MEDIKIDDENCLPEDLENESLRPAVIDELKKIGFDNIAIIWKRLHLTEEKESIGICNKASVYDEIIRDYEQSIFQDLESFLGTIRIEVVNNFILPICNSFFLRLMRYHQAYMKLLILITF